MTETELTAWTEELLETACKWREDAPYFNAHVVLLRANGERTLAYLDMPPAQFALPVSLLVLQEHAVAVAILMDTWVADEKLMAAAPNAPVREVPGRSDAMTVISECPDGRCVATRRYTEVDGEMVWGEVQSLAGKAFVRSRFLSLVVWP